MTIFQILTLITCRINATQELSVVDTVIENYLLENFDEFVYIIVICSGQIRKFLSMNCFGKNGNSKDAFKFFEFLQIEEKPLNV